MARISSTPSGDAPFSSVRPSVRDTPFVPALAPPSQSVRAPLFARVQRQATDVFVDATGRTEFRFVQPSTRPPSPGKTRRLTASFENSRWNGAFVEAGTS